ncbi:hypothetical protein HYU45_03965 [Candidatus Daviesbacteria bacterium]|nr:hypothetical protein [Candidatus Daviesbacteria bacterium]
MDQESAPAAPRNPREVWNQLKQDQRAGNIPAVLQGIYTLDQISIPSSQDPNQEIPLTQTPQLEAYLKTVVGPTKHVQEALRLNLQKADEEKDSRYAEKTLRLAELLGIDLPLTAEPPPAEAPAPDILPNPFLEPKTAELVTPAGAEHAIPETAPAPGTLPGQTPVLREVEKIPLSPERLVAEETAIQQVQGLGNQMTRFGLTEQELINLQAEISKMSDAELQHFTERIIRERYRVQTDKLGVRMPQGDFLPVDGQKITSFWDEEGTIQPSHADPEEVEKRLPKVGFWGGNDGALTFVGPDGRYWVGFGSDENIKALEAAGYKNSGQHGVDANRVNNIMNADCAFADPDLQTQWETYLSPTDSLIQPDKRENEALEEKAERLLRSVTRAEFASFQEYSLVSNRSGKGFVSMRPQPYVGREYPHNSYPENYQDSDLINSEFGKRSWYIPISIARLIDPALVTERMGQPDTEWGELYCVVGRREGRVIIQGGGKMHPDFAHRPNYSSFKLVFDSEDAANEYISWLVKDPKEAYGPVLRRAIGNYDEQGNFRQALIPPKEFNMGKERFSDPFSVVPNKVLVKDLRTSDVTSTTAIPNQRPFGSDVVLEEIPQPQPADSEQITLTPEIRTQLEPLFNQLREAYASKPEETNATYRQHINYLEERIERLLGLQADANSNTRKAESNKHAYGYTSDKPLFRLRRIIETAERKPGTLERFFDQFSPDMQEALRQYYEAQQAISRGEDGKWGDSDQAQRTLLDLISQQIGTSEDLSINSIKFEERKSEFTALLEKGRIIPIEDLAQALAARNRAEIAMLRSYYDMFLKEADFFLEAAKKAKINLET